MKTQLEDKLKNQRGIDKHGRFYQWLERNCTKAKSHEEVRHILGKIKKPIKKVIDD